MTNRPALRVIAAALVIVLIASVSHVSALSETFEEHIDENGWANMQNMGTYSSSYPTFNKLHINSIESFAGLKYVTAIMYEKPHATYVSNMPVDGSSAYTSVVAKIGDTVVGEGIVGYSSNLNSDGTWKNTVYYVDFDYFDPKSFSGLKKVDLVWDSNVVPVVMIKTHAGLSSGSVGWQSKYARFDGENFVGGTPVGGKISHSYYTKLDWKNTLELESQAGGVNIDLRRFNCPSTIIVTDNVSQNVVYQKTDSKDYSGIVRATSVVIDLVSPSKTYTLRYPTDGPSDPTAPATATVTVYTQNAQTGALIANTDLAINEYGTENWYNSTLEWGWTAVDLPAGNYEFYAFADGFTQFAPGRLTVDDNGDSLTLLLYPDELPPSAGNVTLQIWANTGDRGDGRYYGISNAEISINGNAGEGAGYSSGILTTNEQGYLNVEVPGNTSYVVYASKLGYIPGESRITVSTYSPVKVSVTLTAGTLPTSPPLTPTIQPTTPKPTQTTPPGSFIDMSAGGIANLFGTTLETGKILLGFLVALAVGMGTAKQLRGGAPEFVVGFLGASFLGHVAGLIPVGFFVLIALLCGVYLAKTYIGGGDNGR